MENEPMHHKIAYWVGDFIEGFGNEAIKGIYAPYWLGTTVRKTYNKFKKDFSELSAAQKTGKISGLGFATLTSAVQVASWHFLAKDYDQQEFYLAFAPGALNILGEGIRWTVNKLSKKNSLETSLN